MAEIHTKTNANRTNLVLLFITIIITFIIIVFFLILELFFS
jgi:hypothetical protein